MSHKRAPSVARRAVAAVLAGVVLGAVPGRALANGRYPLSQQFLVSPADASELYLRTTYGILASRDTGASWSWICETGVGYDTGDDPMMGVFADGTVVAAASSGLYVTHDAGCGWAAAPSLGDRYVRDVAFDAAKQTGFVVTLLVEQNGTYDSVVWRSSDSAATWTALGPPIAPSAIPFTIDVAPSDPSRLYVSAADVSVVDAGPSRQDAPGIILRSRDGGVTWEQRPIPGTTRQSAPYIGAVHPTNPDVLFVRVRGEWDGENPVQSALLLSEDAGDTWRELFRANADMLGFAVSGDGSTYFIGMGDTHDVLRPVDKSVIGLYRGAFPPGGVTRVSDQQAGCLAYVGDALYVCGGQESNGFELGRSMDDGAHVESVFQYGSVKGPLECPAGSPEKTVCEPQWQYACRGLGQCPKADGGTAPASQGGGSGCCGSSSGPGSGSEIGSARLDMMPEAGGWLALLAAGASLLRRLAGRRERSR
jgi:hypothetical protein